MDEVSFDERTGRIKNPSLAERHVPVHLDVPGIDVQARGAWARLARPASAPRLFNARGKRARDLPIPPDKLMELTSHRTRRGPGPGLGQVPRSLRRGDRDRRCGRVSGEPEKQVHQWSGAAGRRRRDAVSGVIELLLRRAGARHNLSRRGTACGSRKPWDPTPFREWSSTTSTPPHAVCPRIVSISEASSNVLGAPVWDQPVFPHSDQWTGSSTTTGISRSVLS